MGSSRTNSKTKGKKREQTENVVETFTSNPPIIRKLVLGTSTILGIGFILSNIATITMLAYLLSQFNISSQEIVFQMSGTILFLMASILLIAVALVIMAGGIRYYKEASCDELMFWGIMLASFYLLCLGIGSAVLSPQISISEMLLVVAPVLVMVSVAIYITPSFWYKIVASILGIVGGVLLATAILYLQPLKLAFADWNLPFLGPFMSMSLLEGIVVILGSIVALVRSMPPERKTKPASHVLFSIIGLIYGISLFVGPFLLSFSFLNAIWKAPWLGPLHALPTWTIGVVIFWSASLFMLEIGGAALIISSCLGFAFAAKEFFA